VLGEIMQPNADAKQQQKKLLTIQNLALKGVELAILQSDYREFRKTTGLDA
jgi:hypothetical protein